jgi:phosphopantothenoylcysteine decarboxylase/phosphopantothenate--cysteine ligase
MLPKSILLIITGSVASYKSLELVRLLRAQDVAVTAILSKGGAKFITPLAVSSLTGTKTYDDLFSLTDEVEMGHIELSRIADLVLVAPASADLLAKMAAGIADDLATTALLATNKPVIVAPAMNHKMWSHAATQRNIRQLKADGIRVIEPSEGEMACGEFGVGRMAEPADIIKFLTSASAQGALVGKHAIVTSGPTSEALDPVRNLSNRSSGKQGHAIAAALAAHGARVTLIAGEVNLPDPTGVMTIHVKDADAMFTAANKALPADIFVAAAAVADWKSAKPSAKKIKKQPGAARLSLDLVPTVDVLAAIGKHKKRPALVIGFAAETENLIANARTKLKTKQADWIVANDVSGSKVFGEDENQVTLVTARGEETWKKISKHAVADRLAEKIANHFSHTRLVKGKSA